MSLKNTPRSYGSLARGLHWATALLILTTFPLGWYAEGLPYDSSEALAYKAQVFSLHKTLGVAAFFVGLIRIFWALTQVHPVAVNPEYRAANWLAALVHYGLYAALLLVPLAGWVHHAAAEGFAPILWPFGQSLPMVPKSLALADAAGVAHVIATKVLLALVILHVAGALKHALIDRDGTLSRMLTGRAAGEDGPKARGAALAAVVLWGGAAALTGAAVSYNPTSGAPDAAPQIMAAAEPGSWQVTGGSLKIAVVQMGTRVEGEFASWQAAIRFDPAATEGNEADVSIALASLKLGAVSDQATGPDFLNAAAIAEARYTARIVPDGDNWLAEGELSLNGRSLPLNMPFTLTPEGEMTRMAGQTTIDRRSFGIGEKYPDEASVGYFVEVLVDLTARPVGNAPEAAQ